MTKLLIMTAALAISGISQAQKKGYVTFQAEIANRNSDTLFIQRQGKPNKILIADKNGVFKDTLTLKTAGLVLISDGAAGMHVYLKNGYDMKMKMDVKILMRRFFFQAQVPLRTITM